MTETEGRLKLLLQKYSDKTANEAEVKELHGLVNSTSESEIESLIAEMMEKAEPQFDSARTEMLLQNILQRRPAAVVPMRRRVLRVVSAAAVIILLGLGSYFAFFRQTEKPSIAKTSAPIQNDLVPGGNKAILTLDGGQTLILDSAKNGALAVQGNTQVVKGDGTLAYNEQQQVGIAQKPMYNSVSTPKGGQYQLTLADGSKVWLNAASSIRFPTAFIGKERRVEITGEAYFEIAHDANKPFHVKVNGVDVQVLGTHFNINAYSDEESIKTTLLEGSVKVSAANKSITIKTGEQAQMNGGNATGFIVNRNVNIDEVMAWKNGKFDFESADIQTIMRQIARWYDVDVVYEGNIPQREFTGKVSRNVNASEVLKILELSKIHFRIEGKKIVVMP